MARYTIQNYLFEKSDSNGLLNGLDIVLEKDHTALFFDNILHNMIRPPIKTPYFFHLIYYEEKM